MGESKLRGNRDERVAAAIKHREDAQAVADAERDRKDYEQNIKIMEAWAKLTPEERNQRLEAAKEDAYQRGQLIANFGWDAGNMLGMMLDSARDRHNVITPKSPHIIPDPEGKNHVK